MRQVSEGRPEMENNYHTMHHQAMMINYVRMTSEKQIAEPKNLWPRYNTQVAESG